MSDNYLNQLIETRMSRFKCNKSKAISSVAADLNVSERQIQYLLAGKRGYTGSVTRLLQHLIHLETHGSLSLDDLPQLSH